jgi:hypothetical protein
MITVGVVAFLLYKAGYTIAALCYIGLGVLSFSVKLGLAVAAANNE